MTAHAWAACSCYVWPVALGATSGRCGFCGGGLERLVDAPADGKARAL